MSLARSPSRRPAGPNDSAPSNTSPITRSKMTLDRVQQGLKVLKQPFEGVKPEVDIVFVPGLGADPERSWESSKTPNFNWITDEKEGIGRDFPKARLMLYQYESAWTGDLKVHQYMQNIARTLLIDLDAKREGLAKLPVVLIGHSMGGLVIAKAITLADSSRDRFPTMLESIAGCLFFGTPFHGTVAATLAAGISVFGEKFGRTVHSKLLELMEPESETLRDLRTDFLRLNNRLVPKTELYFFYEEHDTDFAQQARYPAALGKIIPKKVAAFVSRDSATMYGNNTNEMGLAANHRDLVKFDIPKDGRYQLVRVELKRIVHGSERIVKSRNNAIRNIDRDTIQGIKKVLEGPSGQSVRRRLDPKQELSLWLKDTEDYKAWIYTPSAQPQRADFMWIKGHVGRGKTNNVISVLNDLEKRFPDFPDASSKELQPLVVYFFCEGSADQVTAEDILKSLILQLIDRQEALASYARNFAKRKEDTRFSLQPSIENLWQTIQDMMYDPFVRNPIYFVINNLHLVKQPSLSTVKLLEYIKNEMKSARNLDSGKVPVRWLISSRNTDSIESVFAQGCVHLIDLEDEKYEGEVQKELRAHAYTKVSALRKEKNYDRDVAYFAHSLIGKRAQNIQWIDITYLHLKALTAADSRLKVRQILDTMPQDVDALLDNAWQQVFRQNINIVEKIKEMLRALVLTFEDPTAEELAVLAGLPSNADTKQELRELVLRCAPLLTPMRRASSKEIQVSFTNVFVKKHLRENRKKLLGLSEDETQWQHGMLAFRSFEHIIERFAVVIVVPVSLDLGPNGADDAGSAGDAKDADQEPELDNADKEQNAQMNVETAVAPEEAREEDNLNIHDDWGEDVIEINDKEEEEKEEDQYDSEDEEEESDPEAEAVKGLAMPYMVKYWLRHAGCATKEIAKDLTASGDADFWSKDSSLRRRWLFEFARLDSQLEGFEVRSFSALHVASALGFPDLVDALIKDGHRAEIDEVDELENTPLHLAANYNQLDIIDVLIESGAKIDHGKEKSDTTPLAMASIEGHVEAMRKLIAKGADINAFASFDDFGSVLNGAISSGNLETVELLISEGVELSFPEDMRTDNIPPPLAEAAWTSNAIFDLLMLKGAGKFSAYDYNEAFIYAASNGQAEVLEKLFNFDHPPRVYQRATKRSVEEDEWEVVKMLLEKRTGLDCREAFIKAATSLDDHTDILFAVWKHTEQALPEEIINEALYKATDLEKLDMVRVLLNDFGADPNAEAPVIPVADEDDTSDEHQGSHEDDVNTTGKNQKKEEDHKDETQNTVEDNKTNGENDKTNANEGGDGAAVDKGEDDDDDEIKSYGNALTASANDGNIDIMELLLEKGAIIDHPAGWPLQMAAKRGHTNVIDKLLARGADVNALTTNENFPQGTALQAACEFGHFEVVRMLLEHGANPNLRPNDSTCPLIAATLNGDENATRLLLDYKSEVNVHGGRRNATPLINAASWLPTEFVTLILQAGANVDDEDEDGDTALILAARRGDADSTKALLDHGADFMRINHSNQNALQVAILNSNANGDCAKLLVNTMSDILLSIKTAMDAGNDAVASVVQAANSERLKAVKTKDVASQLASEHDSTGITSDDHKSQLPIPRDLQYLPPSNQVEKSNEIVDAQGVSPAFNSGNKQYSFLSVPSSDYKMDDSPAQQQKSSVDLTPNIYNLTPSMTQQLQNISVSNGWPQSQYTSNQPQHFGTEAYSSYVSQNYQATENSNQWGANDAYSQDEPADRIHNSGQQSYMPYHYDQGVSNQWQQQQQQPPPPQQQQPMRPGSEDRKSSSSSLFGPNMRDSFEKAKQFGLNRWRS